MAVSDGQCGVQYARSVVEVATAAGLPTTEAHQILVSRHFKDAVDTDWQRARQLGVTGVPTFVAQGRGVVGAQPYEVLERLVVLAGAQRRAPEATSPLIGRVQAGNMGVRQLETLLARRLADGYLVSPQVSVAVLQHKSQQVHVMDAVKAPGAYPLQRQSTVLDMLSAAGGPTPEAGFEVLLVRAKDVKAQPSGTRNASYWGLWEDRPEWLGATVHRIDAGIDTGEVLAYAPVTPQTPGEDYPPLYVRATQEGVARLLEVLTRLDTGEQWCLQPPAPGSVYRSTMPGWKLLLLQCKLARQRRQGAGLRPAPTQSRQGAP